MAEITATILDKISRSAVFVADLTPVGETPDRKALPNPNVLIELGWALRDLGPDRIIAVLNTAGGWKPDDLPFDIRHRRAMTYELAEPADKKTREVARKKARAGTDCRPPSQSRAVCRRPGSLTADQGVAAKADDPSIWPSAAGKLDHHDFIRGRVSCALLSCSRGYIRIVPAGWKNGIPSVNEIANISSEDAVQPQFEGSREGDFGSCEEGYARYWLTDVLSDEDLETTFGTRNVAMWFDETGEFWVIHGTAIVEWRKGHRRLAVPSLIRGWHSSLRRAMAIFNRLDAFPVRRVEAGLTGVLGVTWPSPFPSN